MLKSTDIIIHVEFQNRTDKLLKLINDKNIEALLITKPENVFYISGLHSTAAALLLTKKRRALITDCRYIGKAREIVSGFEPVMCTSSIEKSVADLAKKVSIDKLWFEESAMTVCSHNQLAKEFTMIVSGAIVDELRSIKEPDEASIIRKSCQIAKTAMEETMSEVKPGMTERQVAALYDVKIIQKGAEAPAFETIVASGKNTAIPHHETGEKVIASGDLVLIDAGARYRHYCSDVTRTFVVGESSAQQNRIIEIVKEAKRRAEVAIKPGVALLDIDNSARQYIKENGFEKEFVHNTGHGVGLEVHEKPVIGPKSKGKAAEGMVFSIEPAVYIEGLGGVRIEDTVMVTQDGIEVLTM